MGGGRVWGGDLIVFVGLRVGYLTDLFLFSLGRGYFNLSSSDVYWDQLNVLRSCTLRMILSMGHKVNT